MRAGWELDSWGWVAALERLREERELSVGQLADELGCAPSYWRHVRAGTMQPGVKLVMFALARYPEIREAFLADCARLAGASRAAGARVVEEVAASRG